MRLKILRLAHSKVPAATIIMTPVSAAIGNLPMTGAPTRMMTKMVKAATIPESLARDPAERFTKVCAIIGQPPIPKKNPFRILAPPCATHSRLEFPFVPVISSTKFRVNSPSVNPTAAIIIAYGKMTCRVSRFSGMFGIWKGGRLPLTEAMSSTCLVSILKIITMAKTTAIATSDAGIFLVTFGSSKTMAMVSATRPAMMRKGVPVSHSVCPFADILNCSS